MSPTRQSARKDRVLKELVDIFIADGFAEVSLGELASRVRCSKSTLYSVAPSKEQLIVSVVRQFFRLATERVEFSVAANLEPREQLDAYLKGISEQLAPASPAFFADVDSFAPARQIYEMNTKIAAQRVQNLVRAAQKGEQTEAHAVFVGTVAGLVMEAIHRGEIEAVTGLADSDAYRALADLVLPGL